MFRWPALPESDAAAPARRPPGVHPPV